MPAGHSDAGRAHCAAGAIARAPPHKKKSIFRAVVQPRFAQSAPLFGLAFECAAYGKGALARFDGFADIRRAEKQIDREFAVFEFVDFAPPIELFVKGAHGRQNGDAGEEGGEMRGGR